MRESQLAYCMKHVGGYGKRIRGLRELRWSQEWSRDKRVEIMSKSVVATMLWEAEIAESSLRRASKLLTRECCSPGWVRFQCHDTRLLLCRVLKVHAVVAHVEPGTQLPALMATGQLA